MPAIFLVIIIIAIIAIIVFIKNVKVVPQAHSFVIERLGDTTSHGVQACIGRYLLLTG